ncbi:MAG: response regulator [Thermoflexales bacterium]|nr:response regulator [Thermoflexales bacterium]
MTLLKTYKQTILKDTRILVIDDSDTVRAYLHSILTPLGAAVDGAATGQEGLDKSVQADYQLIFLDLLLPDTDGMHVLQQIRTKNEHSTIIILTSFGSTKSAVAAMQKGADSYLEKQEFPASGDRAEFLKLIKQASNHRASQLARKQAVLAASPQAMAIHDLHDPAVAVLTATEILSQGDMGELSPEQQQFITIAHIAAQRLANLSHYLNHIPPGSDQLKLELERVDLREVIKASAPIFVLQARAKSQVLALGLPSQAVHVRADIERLVQALDNLISNAITYTPEGGHVTVHLQADQGRAVLRVSDTGAGIPPERMSSLFSERSERRQSQDELENTGSGLLIAKKIVEAHRGTLSAESEDVEGKGATFVISLALDVESAPPQPPSEDSREAPVPPTTPELLPQEEPGLPLAPVQDPELTRLFFDESRGQIRSLQNAISGLYFKPQDQQLIEVAHRTSHTLKGNALTMQQVEIHKLTVQMDDVLKQADKGSLTLTQIHVRRLAHLLDLIANLLEEGERSLPAQLSGHRPGGTRMLGH